MPKWTAKYEKDGAATFSWPSGYAITYYPPREGSYVAHFAVYPGGLTHVFDGPPRWWRLPHHVWRWGWSVLHHLAMGRGLNDCRPDLHLLTRLVATLKAHWRYPH